MVSRASARRPARCVSSSSRGVRSITQNRADRCAIVGQERHARVEADAEVAGHERVGFEARVARRVGHFHEHVGFFDRVAAERDVAARFARIETTAGLEPLLFTIDQRHPAIGVAQRIEARLTMSL